MKKIALLLVATFSLASCGGGSSLPSDFVIPSNLQTTLNPTTYEAGSEELAAFKRINSFRNSMGLGYWQQNVLLDSAAQHHMTYSSRNGSTFQQDIEVDGNDGFTGITPSERAIRTGYFFTTNTLTDTNVPTAPVGELYATGPGIDVINSMVNTIYHRSGLLTQSTLEVGLARDTTGAATPATHWWFSHGRLTSGQYVASNYVSNYPIDLQTNVPLSMTPESPSVYPPNFDFATQTSSPVSFTSAASTTLSVTSFTVTPAGSTTPLPGTVWTFLNDPNLLSSNSSTTPNSIDKSSAPVPTLAQYEAYWVGKAPFLPNTTYNVTFTGSTSLVVNVESTLTNQIKKSWSFTTGNS